MIRPLTRTILIGVVGVVCVGAGWAIASRAAVGVGILILAAIAIDACRFGLVEARMGSVPLLRSASPNPCTAGQTMTIRLVPDSSNPHLRATPVADVEETLPRELSIRVHLHEANARSAALSYDVTLPRRGQWVLGPCVVIRFSPLGLWWVRVPDRGVSQVTAWPTTIPLSFPALAQDQEGVVGHTGYVRPHQDNAIVRTYQPGDDLRRIHWRSSARRGELMTRSEEPIDAEHAWVGLVLPPGVGSERRERAISLAASWILAMEHAGYAVDLACGGAVRHGDCHSHLTTLAALTPSLMELALPTSPPEGVSLLVVAGSPTHGLPEGYVVSPPPGHRSNRASAAIAVVWSASSIDAQVVESGGWSVLRMEEDTSLVQAGGLLSRHVHRMQEVMA